MIKEEELKISKSRRLSFGVKWICITILYRNRRGIQEGDGVREWRYVRAAGIFTLVEWNGVGGGLLLDIYICMHTIRPSSVKIRPGLDLA